MPGNVLSWKSAIEKGYEPRLYSYKVEDVPAGEYNAVLDFKVWAKKVMAVNCYFTLVDIDKKIQLTVYCMKRTGVYRIQGSDIDFTKCELGAVYQICVTHEKNRVVFKKAILDVANANKSVPPTKETS